MKNEINNLYKILSQIADEMYTAKNTNLELYQKLDAIYWFVERKIFFLTHNYEIKNFWNTGVWVPSKGGAGRKHEPRFNYRANALASYILRADDDADAAERVARVAKKLAGKRAKKNILKHESYYNR